MKKILSDSQIGILRDSGIISQSEVAFRSGDLVVAEDVVTRQRRIVENADKVLSESKRLLKG